MTRAPDLLIDYLAERDIPCQRCGYNLRGATTVHCPECGEIIPRPPADFTERIRVDPATLRLFCQDCGYTLSGDNPTRCPECGSSKLRSYTTPNPPFVRKRRLPPLIVIVLCALGALAFVTCLAEALANSARPAFARSLTANPRLGAVISLIPIMMAIAWFFTRREIVRLDVGPRKALTLLTLVVGVACFLLALRTL